MNFEIIFKEIVQNFGYFGIFILAILTSAMLFVGPTYLLPPICIALGYDPIILAFVIGIGSAIGETTGYFLGLAGRKAIKDPKILKKIDKYKPLFEKYGGFTLFIFALTPLPMDVGGIIAGLEKYSIWEFLFWVSLGKIIRFLIINLSIVGVLKFF